MNLEQRAFLKTFNSNILIEITNVCGLYLCTEGVLMDLVNVILAEPCEQIVNIFYDNSIDLIVTSPPYNVNLGKNKFNKNGYDLYNDNKPHEEYITWLRKIFSLYYPKIREGGRVCLVIGDGKNGSIPTHSDVIQFMTKDLNFTPITSIIWNKKYTSNRAAFGSWLSPSCPSFPRTFEFILVFGKGSRKLQTTGKTDLTRDEFVSWTNSIWEILPETEMKRWHHPSMFPVEIPKRLIKMFSWRDALVVDPFGGVGTTALAAMQLGRRYVSIDISQDYCNTAESRIADVKFGEKE